MAFETKQDILNLEHSFQTGTKYVATLTKDFHHLHAGDEVIVAKTLTNQYANPVPQPAVFIRYDTYYEGAVDLLYPEYCRTFMKITRKYHDGEKIRKEII